MNSIRPHLGMKQFYPGRYHPDALVDLLDREKVSFSHCVPTILQMVLASAKTKGVELSGWKVVFGGVALPQALGRQALEQGATCVLAMACRRPARS